jgi:hypothetical protein
MLMEIEFSGQILEKYLNIIIIVGSTALGRPRPPLEVS